jgi:hypothetical protein
MPRQTSRKATVTKVGTEARHQYVPADNVSDESWKTVFTLTEPEIPILLDRGTFEWLWDFVSRKGAQADAPNFHYSDLHKAVYQRAANQFAVAAKEAFGDTYLVKTAAKTSKKVEEAPAEAPVEPSKRRRRRRPSGTTEEKFQAAEGLVKASKGRRRRKPRSTT